MHKKTGVIGTTGPEMRRFFFHVNEAVDLINTALNNIEDIKGKVLSRVMKSAKIEDVLRVWIENKGGKWEKLDTRPGERNDEFLVGEIELPFTVEKYYNNIKHFIISFNQKSENSLGKIFSTKNAERLSDDEILKLINNIPKF
jgi:UDP-glucose 4-epimerase